MPDSAAPPPRSILKALPRAGFARRFRRQSVQEQLFQRSYHAGPSFPVAVKPPARWSARPDMSHRRQPLGTCALAQAGGQPQPTAKPAERCFRPHPPPSDTRRTRTVAQQIHRRTGPVLRGTTATAGLDAQHTHTTPDIWTQSTVRLVGGRDPTRCLGSIRTRPHPSATGE